MTAPQCIGLKADGSRCGSTFGLSPEGLCYNHDPDRGTERSVARRRAAKLGGQAKARKYTAPTPFDQDLLPPLDSLDAAQKWLEVVGRARAQGLLTHSDVSAYARLVSEWVKTQGARFVNEEVQRLQARLREIEGELAAATAGKARLSAS